MKKNKEPAIIKRDTVNNWAKSTYIPAQNVIIIMDKEDGGVLLKIGDGQTNVNDLPDILKNKSNPPLKKLKKLNQIIQYMICMMQTQFIV